MSRCLIGLLIALAGCGVEYPGVDVTEVRARYKGSFPASECNSWIYSSVTGKSYCSSPKLDKDAVNAQNDAMMAKRDTRRGADAPAAGTPEVAAAGGGSVDGKALYERVCVACHQATGEGLPGVFPPLAGAGDYYGDAQNMAKIIVHGLSGEITVKGTTYNSMMPPQGAMLNDEEVAAVATYVRTHFGNSDGEVTVADVAAIR